MNGKFNDQNSDVVFSVFARAVDDEELDEEDDDAAALEEDDEENEEVDVEDDADSNT